MEGSIKIEQPEKPQLPVGEAEKMNEMVQKRWKKHLLLFSQVENEVLDANPAFEGTLPPALKLEKGKPNPFLGFFAEAAFKEKPGELPAGKQALEVWVSHGRSAIIAREFFTDTESRVYRDVDLKGIGYLNCFRVMDLHKNEGAFPIHDGLLDSDTAFADCCLAEEFLSVGIRVVRVLGIIKLKELITEGKKISLEEATKMGIINENFHPVIEVRAYGTKLRIDDVLSANPEEKQIIMEDTKKLISQELGKEKTLSNEEYLEWFAKTLGYNVGLIHKNGWFYDGLSTHNITLDCRIVDLDSVAELRNNKERLEDIKSPSVATKILTANLMPTGDPKLEESIERLERQFLRSYNAVFPLKEREKYFAKFKKMPKETEGV